MPFNIGGTELIFILVIVLIVFGAGKLPDVLGPATYGALFPQEGHDRVPSPAGPS